MENYKLSKIFVIGLFLLFVGTVCAQSNYLNKKVTLVENNLTLKKTFNAIRTQTGCIFSYDPSILNENTLIKSPTKPLYVGELLTYTLPSDIKFSITGRYIILKKGDKLKNEQNSPKKFKTPTSKMKDEGLIDKNSNLERLVLPPLEQQLAISNRISNNTTADSLITTVIDSTNIQTTTSKPTEIELDTITRQIELEKLVEKELENKGFGRILTNHGYLKVSTSITDQLAAFSLQVGLYDVYGIVSIGSDYYDSYLLGIGAGTNFKINKSFSVNFDILYNSLIAGKSYELQVRASNTQIIPALNYNIFKGIGIFAGPTINFIESTYVSSISTTNLGLLVGLGYSIGIKIDMKKLILKNL